MIAWVILTIILFLKEKLNVCTADNQQFSTLQFAVIL